MRILLVYIFLSCYLPCCYSQAIVCNKQTIFKFDFGSATTAGMNLSFLANYRESGNSCPEDGAYSFTTSTSDCFGGNWMTIPEDHTPGDVNGKMMLVNSSHSPGEFFLVKVRGLKPTTIYEISAWILNVCQRTVNCRTLYPNIDFIIKGTDGRMIAKFGTGEIPFEGLAWKRYSARFTTSTSVGDVVISLVNKEEGGCGNDFAIDDILLTSCETILPAEPVVEKPVKPTAQKVTKPDVKETTRSPVVIKPDTLVRNRNPLPRLNTPVSKPVTIEPMRVKPAPLVIKERSNPVVREILTAPGELLVELYDNGVIDGDTVSVYHNNELVIAQAGLGTKPLSLKIRCDANQPIHELVMVAHNLGSIPPNTSLMIVTAGEKRYEVFISSDNKKNAKVLIKLQQKQ